MTVGFEVIGGVAGQGGTTLTPGAAVFSGSGQIPAGSGTGWLAVIFWGNATDAAVIYDDEVWDFCGDVEGGDGTWTADSGTRHISAFFTTENIDDTTQAFVNGGANDLGNMIFGYLIRCTKTLAYWERPQVAGAFDNVGGASYAATFNRDPGGEIGDLAIWATVANTDAVNPAGLTLTWPGVVGTAVATVTTPSSLGHDSRANIRRTPITGGGSTGDAPSVTSSTTFTGAAMLVRLRDTNTQPVPAPVAATDGAASVDPWVEFALDGSASTYLPGATFTWSDVTVGGTGAVTITAPTHLVTTARVSPTVWADEDYTFELEITDAGGSDTATVVKTVLRSSEMIGVGGVDRPLRLLLD